MGGLVNIIRNGNPNKIDVPNDKTAPFTLDQAPLIKAMCARFDRPLGRPSHDRRIRIYTREECEGSLNGIYHEGGECTKNDTGSYSWDCRVLNLLPDEQLAQSGPPQPMVSGPPVPSTGGAKRRKKSVTRNKKSSRRKRAHRKK